MNLLSAAIKRQNTSRPPVWLMRQAGRYHSHYQKLRQKYSFVELCKMPEVACEATMGPIRDFDFDAAILFSDLLFPLEAMGMGLRYDDGPKLDFHITETADLRKLHSGGKLVENLEFQAQALRLIRKELSPDKGLLGFVGGPLTLYCYAVEGSHQGHMTSARMGLKDGRFEGFFEKLLDLLVENMVLQAQAGADCVAVLDTCVGEFEASIYRDSVVPYLAIVLNRFKERCPDTPVVYYSKGTGPDHWSCLKVESLKDTIACIGIDWKQDLVETLSNRNNSWAIQGNIDPHWLFLDSQELEARLRKVWGGVKDLSPELRRGWICGLGHGVLPKTPEENVRLFVRLQREMFS